MRARSTLLTVGTVVLALVPHQAASAAWEVTGTGVGQVSAGTLPAAPTPVLTQSTVLGVRTVTVSWPTPADGVPVTGWRVTRTGSSGPLTGTCAGVTTVLGLTGVLAVIGTPPTVTCTDLPGLTGAVSYAVTPVSGSWTGTASAWSAPSA